jgi:protein-disulfide isomerase
LVGQLVEQVRQTRPDVELRDVDVTEQPEIAVTYGVTSTPAIAINGRLELVGVPPADVLLRRVHAAER